MNLQDKIVLAHKGFFDKESEKIYKENSVEVCKISTTKDYISIIELDVRKSKDGVLFCYHGTLFQYWFGFIIPQFFFDIKKKYHVDTLAEILSVITEDKIIFFDLKSKSITKSDILNAVKGKKFRQVIIGGLANNTYSSHNFNDLPEEFVRIMNGHVFCIFYDLKKLKDRGYAYFEVVFPFQVNKKIIQRVKENNMDFRCTGLFFRNKKNYWRKIKEYNINHVSSDFI